MFWLPAPVAFITEKEVRKEPQGFWVGLRVPLDKAVELGKGHVYRLESIWLAFAMVGRI